MDFPPKRIANVAPDSSSQPLLPQGTKASGLLTLPRELRDQIYRYLLPSRRVMRCTQLPWDDKNIINTDIFYINTQIFQEAQEILLKDNTVLYEKWRPLAPESAIRKAPKIKAQLGYSTTYNGIDRRIQLVQFLKLGMSVPLRELEIDIGVLGSNDFV